MKAWLQGLPTTPFRIVASVSVFVLTSVVVCARLASGYDLGDNYQWFFAMILGVMGVDTAHYFAKRKTEWQPSTEMVDMTTRKQMDPEKITFTEEHAVVVQAAKSMPFGGVSNDRA
jgi:hypothetical protein